MAVEACTTRKKAYSVRALVLMAVASIGCRRPQRRAPEPSTPPIRSAPAIITDGSIPWSPNVPRTCHSRHLLAPTEHALQECPSNIVEQTVAWHPDAIVVLGGGILAPGQPGCATAQRAFAAHELFESLARRPWLLLSGHGPVEPSRPVDGIEALCVRERYRQELFAPALEGVTRDTILRDQLDFARTNAAVLTEADYMCAGILQFYPPEIRSAVVTHFLFEPRATSTVENANYSTPILGARHLDRALILSTPVVHADHSIDNHPARALEDFRRDRTRGVHHTRLAAVGCPFEQGGPAWAEFE